MAEVASRRAVDRAEAAAMYGVSFDYIKRAVARGDIAAKKVGRSYRIAVADLETWFAALPDA